MSNPRAQVTLAAFAGLYGGFDMSVRECKRARKHTCKVCGEPIPPGKPGRRCKACREANRDDESGPLIHLSDRRNKDNKQ